jgi:4-carboxymuconolactone decarboxylase
MSASDDRGRLGPENLAELEHLLAEVWDRPGLSTRDRRLLVLGVIAGQGRSELAEGQFAEALENGELTREELGEVVLQLAFYAGWPKTTSISRGARAAAKTVLGDE